MIMISFIFVAGCMQAPNSKRSVLKSASSSDNTKVPTKIPDFQTGVNYLQNGSTVYTTIANFDISFTDALVLRGKDVDSYIRASGTQNIVCLTSRFANPAVNKIIILAAIPRSIYNFTTRTLEYYFNILPADQAQNQNFCQKPGLLNQLSTLYSNPILTPTYKISDLCPALSPCLSNYAGDSLQLFTASGGAVTMVSTGQLKFSLTNIPASNNSSGVTCTLSSECKAQGYDCCSLGQCVKDLAIKPGIVTTSPDYVQALQDILNNPANVYLYPQYYFICSQPTNIPTSPALPIDPSIEASVRLENLTNLFNCSTKIEGEYGRCTKTIKNAVVGTTYNSGVDDRSFQETFTHLTVSKETLVSVEEVKFGGVILFNYAQKTNAILAQDVYDEAVTHVRIEGIHNDDLASGANVLIKTRPPGAVSNDLVIRYKIDASCTAINTTLAKCEKHYVQDQENSGDTIELNRRGRVTDHFPDSNQFKIPYYANTARTVTVEVDGIIQRLDTDYQIIVSSTSYIEFLPVNVLNVFKDQKVKITYFSTLAPAQLMPSKMQALNEIKTICGCNDVNCTLTPIKNTMNVITDYACVYPEPNLPEPPLSQKVFLSSKSVPVRYFDANGASQGSITSSTLKQEGGTPFSYRKANLLNPNNMPDTNLPPAILDTTNNDTNYYIGFSEIYGALSYANNSAKPAKEVSVKKGSTYDIYVDRGVFSSCIQCGSDYYSNLTKLFPYTEYGGGLFPLQSQTNRQSGNTIRGDDMSFGRACVVPASMIPWGHRPESVGQQQRLGRMRAQHFSHANGYQYDWYGFDYGSVIGSFDGVKWFAIGTNRRIKADTNKLFIAVNGQFGDLTLESTYEVSVIDSSMNPDATNMVTKDFDSDGAQCQRYHQCSTDNDCATTLGWDYACAAVNQITTSWPKFDANAKEIPDTNHDSSSLTSILGISSSGKRCIYRGRGSLCTPNFQARSTQAVPTPSFNDSTGKVFHACSANNYCQSISTLGVSQNKFNNRIVRNGKVKIDTTVDSFGFGARIPGRPYDYQGLEAIRSETLRNFNANKAYAMCLPGKNVEINTFVDQNLTVPPTSPKSLGDKVLGIGMTSESLTSTSNSQYLTSCSTIDATKNFYHINTTDGTSTKIGNMDLVFDSGTQNISTNVLSIFQTIFDNKGLRFNMLKNNSEVLNSVAYSKNRCMRAPAASCFSDMDCSPSKALADKIKVLTHDDPTITVSMNKYEIKFWQEDLVCSQETLKTSTNYDPKNNRCCRDVGKTISIASKDLNNPLKTDSVAGIDIAISDRLRYSRVSTIYKDMKTPATAANFPALASAITDQCGLGSCLVSGVTTQNVTNASCIISAGTWTAYGCQQIIVNSINVMLNQFKSFSTIADRTSCTGDWIRNFATGTSKWESTRFQKFDPKIFQCYNWLPGVVLGGIAYSCEGLEEDDPDCKIIQTLPSSAKAKGIFDYLGRLELMGIPQIMMETTAFYSGAIDNHMSCRSSPLGQNLAYPGHITNPITNYSPPRKLFISPSPTAEYINPTGQEFYSAIDPTNFVGTTMKTIFKADEVRVCFPGGTQMKLGDEANLCCTGYINPQNNKCQLPDYNDVSVYTNRFVSSEAKKLNSSLFDTNGYVKDPYYVVLLACEKQICASGVMGMGTLVTNLKTPGRADSQEKLFRFIEGAAIVDDESKLLEIFNKGLKLNNHAYCLPRQFNGQSNPDFTIISCGY